MISANLLRQELGERHLAFVAGPSRRWVTEASNYNSGAG